jgi:aryl-alcohol dehydrogenase-like predicted oxidoreductase
MNHRPLGRSGLSTAPLVFGGNVFGWTADEATSHRLLDAFVDGGFNAVDTADVYSAWVPGHAGGESESVIGRWLKARGKRDDVLILTKVAMWPASSRACRRPTSSRRSRVRSSGCRPTISTSTRPTRTTPKRRSRRRSRPSTRW